METDVRDELSEFNDEMLFADGFDEAIIGIVERAGQPTVALYDTRKCIKILMDEDGMSYDEALEYFEFNILGSYMGKNTPAFCTLYSENRL